MKRRMLYNIFQVATIEIAAKLNWIVSKLKNMSSLAWSHSIIKFITLISF